MYNKMIDSLLPKIRELSCPLSSFSKASFCYLKAITHLVSPARNALYSEVYPNDKQQNLAEGLALSKPDYDSRGLDFFIHYRFIMAYKNPDI